MSAKYKPSSYEVLRRRCVELKESGWKQKDIALALGLTESWVSQTLKKHHKLGSDGLLARKPPGSLPKLAAKQHYAVSWRVGAGHGQPRLPRPYLDMLARQRSDWQTFRR